MTVRAGQRRILARLRNRSRTRAAEYVHKATVSCLSSLSLFSEFQRHGRAFSSDEHTKMKRSLEPINQGSDTFQRRQGQIVSSKGNERETGLTDFPPSGLENFSAKLLKVYSKLLLICCYWDSRALDFRLAIIDARRRRFSRPRVIQTKPCGRVCSGQLTRVAVTPTRNKPVIIVIIPVIAGPTSV